MSLALNDAGVFVGVLSPSPMKVTMRDVEGFAAAVSFICAFSSASLFLFLRRQSLAAFLALFLAFSILLCRLPKGTSADGSETDAKADDEAASSPPVNGGTGSALGKASDGAAVDSLFPLLFWLFAVSRSFFEVEEFPVSDAVAGVERAPIAVELEVEAWIFLGVV